MGSDGKALALGVAVGIIISLIVFVGGILLWVQVSSADLTVPANQTATITIGERTINFTYNPVANQFTENTNKCPARVGFVGSWSWGKYTVIQATPDQLVLHFRPWKFSSIQDVMSGN